jgi:hypothetical protein
LPGNDTGAFGLSSMAWSQICNGGNSCDMSSEKTLEYCWYCSGMFASGRLPLGLMITLPIYSLSLGVILGLLTCHGRKHVLSISWVLKIIGSCIWSIHPRFQSIRGWKAANHGYPRMALFSSKSERKNQSVECCAPVCT